MKIIHLTYGKANPERMNGINKIVHQLATNQTDLGHEVTLWGIASNLEHNYPKRNFPTILFQQNTYRTISSRLKKAIADLPKDATLHIHGAFIIEFFQVTQLLKKRGIPYVFTPHGSFAASAMLQNKWMKKIYFQLLEKRLIKNALAVQLSGVGEFEHLDKMIKIPHVALIPNGIEAIPTPTIEATKKTDFLMGFCGRLDINHKGLDLMLQGFHLFLEKGGKGQLELIGDGTDRPTLEKMAADLGITNQVTFHGALFNLKKIQTLCRIDTFLHTSRMEGFPMSVLEATALGIPCITSEATNFNDYIRENKAGIPIVENTPSGIAEAMQKAENLYQKNELHLLGENAKVMANKVFDWQNIAQQLINTYAA